MKKPRPQPLGVSKITVRPEDINVTLLEMRLASRLTQADAAELAGFLSPATVSNYENSRRRLSLENLDRILLAYGFCVASVTLRRIDKQK